MLLCVSHLLFFILCIVVLQGYKTKVHFHQVFALLMYSGRNKNQSSVTQLIFEKQNSL